MKHPQPIWDRPEASFVEDSMRQSRRASTLTRPCDSVTLVVQSQLPLPALVHRVNDVFRSETCISARSAAIGGSKGWGSMKVRSAARAETHGSKYTSCFFTPKVAAPKVASRPKSSSPRSRPRPTVDPCSS